MPNLTINLTDINGANGRITVNNVTGLTDTKAKAFIEWIKDHTDAAIKSFTISTPVTYTYDGDSPTDGEHRSVQHVMKGQFLRAASDTGAVLGRMSIIIPAPDDSDFDGDGQMKSDVANDFAEALEALTGQKLVYQGCYLQTRHPMVVKKEVTGV
jgi:hypothetical protein